MRCSEATAHRDARGGGGKKWERTCKPGSVEGCHSSRTCVTARLQQPTRGRRGPRHGPLLGLAPGEVYRAVAVARDAVGPYPTVSPLPDPANRPSAVCSLWHCLSARAAQALPGALPCGARTFLPMPRHAATAQSPPIAMVALMHPVPGQRCGSGGPDHLARTPRQWQQYPPAARGA